MHYLPIKYLIFIPCRKKSPLIFWKHRKDNLAIFRSKAVGEPPLMYGIGAYFAYAMP